MSGGGGGGGFFSPLCSATEQLSEVADGRLVSSFPFSVFFNLFVSKYVKLGAGGKRPLPSLLAM